VAEIRAIRNPDSFFGRHFRQSRGSLRSVQSTGSFVAALPVRAANVHGSGFHNGGGMKCRKSKTVHLFFDD
jgi:hypothetical protein